VEPDARERHPVPENTEKVKGQAFFLSLYFFGDWLKTRRGV
jgi:hypothetical protein